MNITFIHSLTLTRRDVGSMFNGFLNVVVSSIYKIVMMKNKFSL